MGDRKRHVEASGPRKFGRKSDNFLASQILKVHFFAGSSLQHATKLRSAPKEGGRKR